MNDEPNVILWGQSGAGVQMQTEVIDASIKIDLVELYRQMYLIREFEERSGEMYTRGLIRGFLHLCSGQEAIAVGAISVLEDRDFIVTHYRDPGSWTRAGTRA